jgi:ribonucleoside-diphosphate reductase beta chain
MVGIKLVNTIREEMPEIFDEEFCDLIRKQCVKAYEAESAIIEWSVNGYQSEHLTSAIMKDFIKNRLNESLEEIGIEPVFDDISQENLDKTQWFEEDVLGNTATDFFFKRPTEYSKNDKSYDEDDLF